MAIKKYQPSNGTEGMYFTSKFCEQCIHEKFLHTEDDGDKQCGILTDTMSLDVKDEDYPEEWRYNQKGEPVCTKFQIWNWRDRDGNLVDPPEEPYVSEDPNQLELFNN